jgi:hypothetical protein
VRRGSSVELPTAERQAEATHPTFQPSLGSVVSDAGLLAFRELDQVLGFVYLFGNLEKAMKRTTHMPLIAALAGALCATSVLMLDAADAETRVIFKVKRPGGEVLEVFRGRPGTGVRAEAREFAAETEGDQVIVKTVKRNGEIVSKEKEREPQTSERRTRDTDDTAQAEETTLSGEATLSPEDSGTDSSESASIDSLVNAANASTQEDQQAGGRRGSRSR